MKVQLEWSLKKERKMTEQKRKLGIRNRSCGVTSPPVKDHYRQPSFKRTQLRGNSKFSAIPSESYITTKIKAKQMTKPQNHSGLGVGLLCAFGNSPSSWACPALAPPQVVEIQSGEGAWVV